MCVNYIDNIMDISRFIDNPKLLCDDINNIIKKSIDNYKCIIILDLNIKSNRDKILSFLSDDVFEFDTLIRIIDLFINIGQYDVKIIEVNRAIKKYNTALNSDYNVLKMLRELNQYYDKHTQEHKFINKIVGCYEKRGIHIKKNSMKKIKKKIEHIECRMMNIPKNKTITLNSDEVNGVPHDFLKCFCNHDKKQFNIVLNKMTYQILLKNIKNGDVRKKIEELYYGDNNFNNFARLIVYRHKYANMLGYPNYCELKTGIRGKRMTTLIENIVSKLDDVCAKEIKILSELKSKRETTSNIYTWDLLYYLNKWKKIYGITENVNEYFEMTNTLSRILEILEMMFSIKFKQCPPIFKLWDPSVITYCITQNDTIIGYVMLDMFVRNNKLNQNKTICLIPRSDYPHNTGTKQLAHIVVFCNIIKQNPTLLSIQDLTNIMREFGHMIHYLLNVTKYSAFNGMNMDLEIVETISTFFQHLSTDGTILKYISQHYKTNEKINDSLIDKICKVKKLDYGITYKYRCLYALYDLFVHSFDEFIDSCHKILKFAGNGADDKLKKLALNYYNKFYEKIMNSDTNYMIKKNETLYHPNIWTYLFNGYDDSTNYTRIIADIYSYNLYNYAVTQGVLNKKIYEKMMTLFNGDQNIPLKSKIKDISNVSPSTEDLFCGIGLSEIGSEYSLYQCDNIMQKDKLSDKDKKKHISPIMINKNLEGDSNEINLFEPISDSEIQEPKKV